MAGCTTPQAPATKAVYDFGPARLVTDLSSGATAAFNGGKPIALASLETTPALDSTAVLYRLAYADAQQLRPYAFARWSMAPAQLVQQRLREALGNSRPVLSVGEGLAPRVLKIELEEFNQEFDTPTTSAGVVRLRATVLQADKLLGQRSFTTRSAAPSADAGGGVRALATASDAAILQITAWLISLDVFPAK